MRQSERRVATSEETPKYGRGTGVPHPVDIEVGMRVRMRRLLLGMNQESLADRLGITFQQVQKYEGGANRVSASRLSAIADILDVPLSYFFANLDPVGTKVSAAEQRWRELQQRPETLDLIRNYYAIPDPAVREQFLAMVRAIAESAKAESAKAGAGKARSSGKAKSSGRGRPSGKARSSGKE